MLRVLEHYTSIQGEGPRTGLPTQFVRFAGCNLRCPKWPCDTPYAIEPKLYRPEQRSVQVPQLVDEIYEEWRRTGARNVCFTGGEPMLQHAEDLHNLVAMLANLDNETMWTMEMFSNGTLPYTDIIIDCVAVVMDWKLPGSGEDSENETRIANYHALEGYNHTVKFTVAHRTDLLAALTLYNEYSMNSWDGDIYCGPVWDASAITPADIVKFILDRQLPWKLNMQLHKYIWPPDARRT